ncbi:MAG: ABC transporter ATP-binding protein [Deltaproteobacteria bacterium]|nr:ABC transporter ATP-binding protein [Deltaproteobacteria bacterium]
MKPMVLLRDVSKDYGRVKAVSDVSLQIPQGRIFGLIGSDGAGKSTLLRMVATMIKPSSGQILLDDLDVSREKNRVKPLIGYMPQRFGLYRDLTVEENLDFFMDIFGITGMERTRRKERYLGFSNLLPFLDRPAGDLSGGMKQKLGLACVLVHQPKVLLLDEPTNGVDPVSRQEFWEILREMRAQGMTIMISTAYLEEGEECDQLAIMHRSRILARGTPQDVKAFHADLEEAMIHHIGNADEDLAHEGFRI